MKSKISLAVLIAVSASLAPLAKAQTTIVGWTFEGLSTSGVNAGPSASTGTGTASTLGMTLNSDTENSGISGQQGTDTGANNNTSSSNLTWKVRGTGSGTYTNGWASNALIASQGAQFSTSTAGYTGIAMSFDWYPSTTGEANLLIQYTTDGSTWVDATADMITLPSSGTLSLVAGSLSDANTVDAAYINTTAGNTWYNDITVNFSTITGVSNDANFGVRLVNASTGVDDVQATGGAALNNTKGNWSFDNVVISGTASAIPEPATCALIFGGLALAGVVVMRLRGCRSARGEG